MNNIWQPLCDKSVTTDYDILYCRLSRDDDMDDRNKWLVDETAAPIVKRIFQMTIDGKGPFQIAKILRNEQIIRPSCHLRG